MKPVSSENESSYENNQKPLSFEAGCSVVYTHDPSSSHERKSSSEDQTIPPTTPTLPSELEHSLDYKPASLPGTNEAQKEFEQEPYGANENSELLQTMLAELNDEVAKQDVTNAAAEMDSEQPGQQELVSATAIEHDGERDLELEEMLISTLEAEDAEEVVGDAKTICRKPDSNP